MKKKISLMFLLPVLLFCCASVQAGTGKYLTCPTPTNLYASNIGENDADVNWDAMGILADDYTLEYKAASSGSWTTVGTFVFNTMNISSLTAGTLYDWRVRTNCRDGSSDWAYGQFYTLDEGVPCGNPRNLRSSPWCLQSDIEWDPVPDATTYDVEYKKTSASTWSTQYGLTYNFTTIYGTPGFYNWRVRTNCAGGTGSWSTSTTSMMIPNACEKRAGGKPGANGEMKLQPQPATSQVTVSYHSDAAVKGNITVHDQFGAVRLNKAVKINEGDNRIELNISSLKQGVYVIRLQAGEQLVSQKLVVSK